MNAKNKKTWNGEHDSGEHFEETVHEMDTIYFPDATERDSGEHFEETLRLLWELMDSDNLNARKIFRPPSSS